MIFFLFSVYISFFQAYFFFFFCSYFCLCFTLESFIKCLMILGCQLTFEWGIKRLIWGFVSRPSWLAHSILESLGYWQPTPCWGTSIKRIKIVFLGAVQFLLFFSKKVVFNFLCARCLAPSFLPIKRQRLLLSP